MAIDINSKKYNCAFEVALDIIGGKWKGLILWHLQSGTHRYSELRKKIPNITQKMLTQKLRELERQRVIDRKIYPEIPPKVEYSLTEFGLELEPILKDMYRWSKNYIKNSEKEIVLNELCKVE